jgi:CRISPR-associated protein Csm4
MPPVEYLIRPLSGFHFGSGREDNPADLEDLPRSDTLASAILSVWHNAEPGTSDSELERMAVSPPFVLSSAMPALKRNGRVETLLFVPPGFAERVVGGDSRAKQLRKARFASADVLRRVQAGKPLSLDALVVSADGSLLGDVLSNFSMPGDEPSKQQLTAIWSERLWLRESRPRLSVGRVSGRANEGVLFRYASTVFRPDLLLAIRAEFASDCRSTFETALRLLGDEGIGGGRSVGHGRFTVVNVRDAPDPGLGHGARLTLSLMHPTLAEITDGLLEPPASYTLVTRAGWAEVRGVGVARRKSLNMLAEGSIVRDLNRNRYGQSVCVRASGPAIPHPVYRSGCALTIPISWSEQHEDTP